MNLMFRKTYKLEKVFTPSTVAKLTYIERRSLETEVVKYLLIPGMQLVLYGHSGCGKSTLIANVIHKQNLKSITTRCDNNTKYNDLLLCAFDQLNPYFKTESTTRNSSVISSSISSQYTSMSLALSNEKSQEEKAIRALPVQLTPQRLAEFLGEAKCVWIIEDFHKVVDSEKKKLLDVLKIFVDTSERYPEMKTVCIGAVGTGRELIEHDSNLSGRIAEVYIPLMTLDELALIVKKGFKMMNIAIPERINIKITYYSNKLASVCHQICYDICYYSNNKKTKFIKKAITDDDLKHAIASFVRKNADTFSKIYEHAIVSRERKNIIESIVSMDKEYLSSEEIYKEIRKKNELQRSVFQASLDDLTMSDCFEILRFDQNSKKYSFSTPIFQTFVKMRLALDELEEKQRLNRRNKKYSLEESSLERINDEKYLEHYFDELDRYYLRNISEIKRLNDKIQDLENYSKMFRKNGR